MTLFLLLKALMLFQILPLLQRHHKIQSFFFLAVTLFHAVVLEVVDHVMRSFEGHELMGIRQVDKADFADVEVALGVPEGIRAEQIGGRPAKVADQRSLVHA